MDRVRGDADGRDGARARPGEARPELARPEVAGADVHRGRDGWLFLTGGTNRVLDQYRRKPGDRRHDWTWRRMIESRALRCALLGARYLHVVVPEKLTVYDDRLDGLCVDTTYAPARRIARWLRFSPARSALVDLVEPLSAVRNSADLYLKTDSHWSTAGAAVAYRALCERLKARPREDLLAEAGPEVFIVGDLGIKLDPPVGETVRPPLLPRDAVRHRVNDLVAHFEAQGRVASLHSAAQVVYRCESPQADPRKILLFGDSFSHFLWSVRSGMLTGLLAETFRELHFLWSPSIDWDYVRNVRPDVVIGEIAERFTVQLPPWRYRHERLAAEVMAERGQRPGSEGAAA